MLRIDLPTLECTALLGRLMAAALSNIQGAGGALLYHGGLGFGKTTLTRELVLSLPHEEPIEVASPSFTICNIYCTFPCVHHYDLYRLGKGCRNDSLAESFDQANILTIVEWAEHIHPEDAPGDGIVCALGMSETHSGRYATLTPLGPKGQEMLLLLKSKGSSLLAFASS